MKKLYALSLLVVVAFALRAAVFWGYLGQDDRYWQVDSATYQTLAEELTDNNRFATHDGTPNAYRVPGYPFFLAAVYKVAGINHHAALWVQIILASFIPLLIYFLTCILFPARRRIAWAAAIVTTFHLGYVLSSGFIMTETLFVLLFLLFLIPFCRAVLRADVEGEDCTKPGGCSSSESSRFYNMMAMNSAAEGQAFVQFFDDMVQPDTVYVCCMRHPEDSEGLDIFFAGMMLGLASLVRPVGHYLIVVAVVVLFFSGKHRLKQLLECGVLSFGWLIIVGGWLIRNFLLFGHLFFHSLPGGHFLYLSAARVVAAEEQISYQDARAQLRSIIQEREAVAIEEKGSVLSTIEVSKLHERLALETFLATPLTSVKIWAQDMFRTIFSLHSAELLYLESERQGIDYFATNRPMSNWFERYLNPQTDKIWLKFLIWAEIIFNALVLFGLAWFCYRVLLGGTHRVSKVLWVVLPFMLLFIVIALSGGYARMRLPMEFLMVILACASVPWLYRKMEKPL